MTLIVNRKKFRKSLKGIFNKTLTVLLMAIFLASGLTPTSVSAASSTIRQEINILDGEPLTSTGTLESQARVLLDTTQYSGTATYYFEAVYSGATSNTGSIKLSRAGTATYDASVAGATSPSTVLTRSASFTPPAGQTEYTVTLSGDGSRSQTVKSARIVVIQTSNPLTQTETQIEIGNYETGKTNTAAAALSAPKYWKYNASSWDGSTTTSAEVTWKKTDNPATISYVGGKGAGSAGQGGGSVSLTTGLTGGSGGAPIAGDLVIVTVSVGTAARQPSIAITTPTGYTALTAQRTTVTALDTNVQTSYKIMTSTPDTTVTIPASGSNQDGIAYTIHVFRGVDPTTPLGGVTPTYATGSGTNDLPNPASITPTTAGSWIYFGGGGAAGTGATYTAGYLTNFLTFNGPDTNDGDVGAGYYTGWSSGAYDGAVWTGGSTNAANSWGATALVLKPGNATTTFTAKIQESDGTGDGFVGWADKATIASALSTNATTTRTRSTSFTPTDGRNYRLVTNQGDANATYALYNAKIIIDSSNWAERQPAGNVNINWRALASDSTGTNLLAPSETGIYTSTNSGANWTERQPVAATWRSAASSSDGAKLIIGALVGRLYTSTNSGANWTERRPAGNVDGWWLAAASDSTGTNLIVGDSTPGRLYTSSDSGANWTERQPGGAVSLQWQAVASDSTGTNLIAAVAGGRLYTSSDSGANWTERQPGGAANLNWRTVSSDSTGTHLIVGVNSGRLYTSSDSGANWTERQPAGNVNAGWLSSASDSTGTNLIVGAYGGRLYTSPDSGVSWTEIQPAGANNLNWVSVASNSTGDKLMAGVYGGRLYTEVVQSITKLEPQYLLANTTLAAGTGFQNFLTNWDSSDWSGVANTYDVSVDSANGSTSVVTVQEQDAGSTVGTVSSPDNSGTAAATMPTSQNLDVKATTNNSDIYATRILVKVGPTITTLGNGTDGSSSTIAPDDPAAEIDRFSLVTNGGTDTLTGATVTLAGNTSAYTNIATVGIYTTGNTLKCSATPSSNTVALTSCGISITTSSTDYVVKITPKTHANMPAVPGASYATTATVTSITVSNTTTGTDTGSATITVDNLSPSVITSPAATPGDQQVSLSWTNPSDSDFTTGGTVVVLRQASSSIVAVPAEGITYSVGDTSLQHSELGSATVACVVTGSPPATTCTDTGLTNGVDYYYKIFTQDSKGNYYADIFSPLSQTPRNWQGISIDESTKDVYAVDNNNNLFVQAGGSGNFVTLNQTPRSWRSIAVDPTNHYVYASVQGGDIYKCTTSCNTGTPTFTALGQTPSGWYDGLSIDSSTHDVFVAAAGGSGQLFVQQSGSGNFISLNQTPANWNPIAVDSSTHYVYAAITGGDIYKCTTSCNTGTPTFTALGQTSRSWYNLSINSVTHDVYATVYGGDIYKQTAGTGNFIAQGQTARNWTGISIDSTNKNVYAAVANADIYKLTSIEPSGGPARPSASTTLSTGTNPGDTTIAPGGSITSVNGFTLVTGSGTDTITSVTVNLSTNSGVGTISITNSSDTVLGSLGGGTGSGIVSGSNTITVSGMTATTTSTFKVKITPLSHTSMPAVPGSSYSITAPVTDWVGTNTKVGQATDTSSTVTIDNTSPTSATVPLASTAGDTSVTLKWTTTSGETTDSVILRWASSSAGSEVPVEGTSYTAGNTITTATVACVFTSQTTATALVKIDGTGGDTGCTTTALTNSQAYSYKVFSKDSNGNYDAGILINGSPLTPTVPSVGCTSQVTSGNWNTTGTWGCGHVPTTADDTVITAGHTITMDVNSAVLGSITINGALNTSDGTSRSLSGTTLSIGSAGSLTANASTITLSGTSGTLFTIASGGTFTPSTSTVVLSGNGDATINSASTAFNNLTLSGTGTKTVGGGGGGSEATFNPLSQNTRVWTAIAVDSTNHNVYSTVYSDDLYKQTAGTGNFAPLSQTGLDYRSIAVDSTNHDVYAAVFGGDIYKQTAGTGSFVPLSQSSLLWYSIAVDSTNHDVYAAVYGGDIYKQTGGTGNFVALSQTSRYWYGLAVDSSNHNVYATDNYGTGSGGDIYKQTGGTGNFVALSQTSRYWYGITVDSSSHNVYAVDNSNGDIYKQTGGTGNFVALGQTTQNWRGIAIDSTTHDIYATIGSGDVYKSIGVSGATNPVFNGTLTLTNGTLDANNNDITASVFSTSNANTRGITMGSGTWTLTGTGTVWDASTATGLTVTPGTSTIKLTDTSSTGKTFAGGSKTYNNIWYAPGAGTGSLTISGDNTFNDFRDNTSSAAHSLLFTTGSTQTLSTWNVSGTSGNLVSINSTNTGTHNLIKLGNVSAISEYINVQHSIASPYGQWVTGNNSVNNQGVATAGSGWIFNTYSGSRGGGSNGNAGGESSGGGTPATGGTGTGGGSGNAGGESGGGGQPATGGTGTGGGGGDVGYFIKRGNMLASVGSINLFYLFKSLFHLL